MAAITSAGRISRYAMCIFSYHCCSDECSLLWTLRHVTLLPVPQLTFVVPHVEVLCLSSLF